jgi:hypothetical protein
MADKFVQTIRSTLSNDNAQRNEAEKQFESAKSAQPAQLVEGLFGILAEPQLEQPLREQAAVLLRKCLEKVGDDNSLWKRLGDAPKVAVLEKLLQLIEVEPLPPVRRKVADCVQSLGNQLITIEDGARPNNIQEWPSLMPGLMRMIMDTSKDSGLRGDCLWAVKEMTVSIYPVLLANGEQTFQVIKQCMADAAEPVCGNATSLLLELIDSTNAKQDRKPFFPLAPEIGQVLQRLASNENSSKHLNEVLQTLQTETEVAEFLKPVAASQVMPILHTIALKHKDEDARKYAMEAIISFFTGAPAAMIQDDAVVNQSLEVCVAFMLQLDDDTDEWMKIDDEETADDSEEFVDVGKSAIDRICKGVNEIEKKGSGFPKILEVLKPAVSKLFQSGQWKETVCGITVLSQIAEYVDDEETVSQMFGAIKMQLKASHPRVRHAAWSGVAQFAQDHSDFLTSSTWAQQVLPEFLAGIGDSVDRVAIRCMEAFQLFGEEVERDDMEPFVPQMMDVLSQRLQGSPAMQRKAITFIAVIAGQVEDGFAQYYGNLMPFLKKIIETTLHKVEERVLLGKCFECISLLAKSVGRAAFRNDAEAIMQAMIKSTQVPNLPSNDPVKEYMMAASERICAVMKEDFLPLVPHILPGILEKFNLAPKEWDSANAKEEDFEGEVNLMLSQGEDGQVKVMLMSSSELEDLQNALSCVHTFVDELKKHYAPFVEATAKALLPVFEFGMDEGVRDMSFETWGGLCAASREAGQVAVVNEMVAEFMRRMLPKLQESTTNNANATIMDCSSMKTRADGVTCCLKKAGTGILNLEAVKAICETALVSLEKSLQRRETLLQAAREAEVAGKDAPPAEEDDDEEGLRISLAEICGAVMQCQPDEFVSTSLQPMLSLVEKMLQGGNVDDRKLVLFISCDFLHHLGPRVYEQWPKFMPVVLQDIMHNDATLRQPACYGVSLAAKEPNFASAAMQAAEHLAQVVSETRKRGKKKSEKPAQACADNALSGLINILQHHQAAVASGEAQLWSVWMAGLPCQEDEEEGVKNHKILLQLIASEKKEVLGQLPKLLGVLVDAYKTDMVDTETSGGIAQLALRIGEAKLQELASSLSEKQKKKLARIVRDAQNAPAQAAFCPPSRA